MENRRDRGLATLLTIWALILHAAFFASAGALWRDEANSIQQARSASFEDVWRSLGFDSFPILYPAFLRIWSSHFWTASDAGLRVFGFIAGLANLASIWGIARLFRISFPIVMLALLAVNPVMIVEGDSVRPYGLSILFTVWACVLLARCIQESRRIWLILASLAAVLSAQSSYTNIVFLGISTLSAIMVSLLEHESPWKLALPGLCAALSLIPYAGTMRAVAVWASIVHDKTDWSRVLGQINGTAGGTAPVLVVVWIGVLSLPAFFLVRILRQRSAGPVLSPLELYSTSAAVLALACQIVFLQSAGAAPFLRYFLTCLVLAALALELALQGRHTRLLRAAALTVALLTVLPTWSWVTLRRTNVDVIAAVLQSRARPQDLVLISPWFLNTSFQRYYHGPAPWMTVPDLARQPIMRYDLIRLKILERDSNAKLGNRVEQVLEEDGSIWVVSQPYLQTAKGTERPALPEASAAPDGGDYVRYRSFWEHDAKYRLAGAAVEEIIELPRSPRVWFEERLVLSRWQKRKT